MRKDVRHNDVVTRRGRANLIGIDPVEGTTASLYNGSTCDTPLARI
jgi:hypothetical protein